MVYKWCIVPQCTNTSIKTPEKLFVSVPTNPNRHSSGTDLNMAANIGTFLMFLAEIKMDAEKLIEAMKATFEVAAIQMIERATRKQTKSSLWYEIRYGRITASKSHEVSVCRTPDGSLVAAIIGAKIPETAAMKRGRNLEEMVRKTISKKLKTKIDLCGLYVCQNYPMIAASPDGVANDAIVEIKCPSKAKSEKECKAQVQIQMYAAGVKKCYFYVADSKFEENETVVIHLVTYDADFVDKLMKKLVDFWKSTIYPILLKNTSV